MGSVSICLGSVNIIEWPVGIRVSYDGLVKSFYIVSLDSFPTAALALVDLNYGE